MLADPAGTAYVGHDGVIQGAWQGSRVGPLPGLKSALTGLIDGWLYGWLWDVALPPDAPDPEIFRHLSGAPDDPEYEAGRKVGEYGAWACWGYRSLLRGGKKLLKRLAF